MANIEIPQLPNIQVRVLKNDSYSSNESLPRTATNKSTGYDLIATSDPEIMGEKRTILDNSGNEQILYSNIEYIQYKTNLKFAIQSESYKIYDALILPRSSIRKYNLTLANSIGLIDHDYRGEILICFKYNWQPEDFIITDGKIEGKINFNKIYKKGDKICQIKFTQVERVGFYLVDNLDSTERGEGGFGSTDNTTPKNAIQDLANLIQNYKKNPVYTPEKKYIDLMKERENNI